MCRDKLVCLHFPSLLVLFASSCCCEYPGVGLLLVSVPCARAGWVPLLLPLAPRPLPLSLPRWSSGPGPAYISIMTSRRPAGQPRPGPVPGPAPGRSCLVRRWVRPGPAAKPAVECKAARARAPTTRAAPGQQPNCGWCHVRAWVPSLHRTCL